MLDFRDTFPNLSAIADGAYDAQLFELAGQIRADGREIQMRPLHEFNGEPHSSAIIDIDNTAVLLHCVIAIAVAQCTASGRMLA